MQQFPLFIHPICSTEILDMRSEMPKFNFLCIADITAYILFLTTDREHLLWQCDIISFSITFDLDLIPREAEWRGSTYPLKKSAL